jgi:uncharacterized protein YgiM (DUF1202 family)
MKKLLGKVLIGLLCIGMLASCGSDEEVTEVTEEALTRMEVSEEQEESEEDVVELPIIESEEQSVEEAELPIIEETVVAENDEEPVEEVAETPVVEEILEVQEPEYSYSGMNQTMYASQSVNVRNLPSTDGERVGGLSAAQAVTVTGKCNETGWYRIEYNGGEAFVSDSYLVNEKPVQQEQVTQPTSSSNSSGSGSGGSSVTVPSHEDTVGNLVWVPTKGGKKYHTNAGCSNMEGPMQVTVEHATALGYTPCKRCH